jgi:hypothetical protein
MLVRNFIAVNHSQIIKPLSIPHRLAALPQPPFGHESVEHAERQHQCTEGDLPERDGRWAVAEIHAEQSARERRNQGECADNRHQPQGRERVAGP